MAAEAVKREARAEDEDEEAAFLYGDGHDGGQHGDVVHTTAAGANAATGAAQAGSAATADGKAAGETTVKQDAAKNGDRNGGGDEDDEDEEDEEDEDEDDASDEDVEIVINKPNVGAPGAPKRPGPPVVSFSFGNKYIKPGTASTTPSTASAPEKHDNAPSAPPLFSFEAPVLYRGQDLLEVDVEDFEEKPWRRPGADITDYFNYGFTEETWRQYAHRQVSLRSDNMQRAQQAGPVQRPPMAMRGGMPGSMPLMQAVGPGQPPMAYMPRPPMQAPMMMVQPPQRMVGPPLGMVQQGTIYPGGISGGLPMDSSGGPLLSTATGEPLLMMLGGGAGGPPGSREAPLPSGSPAGARRPPPPPPSSQPPPPAGPPPRTASSDAPLIQIAGGAPPLAVYARRRAVGPSVPPPSRGSSSSVPLFTVGRADLLAQRPPPDNAPGVKRERSPDDTSGGSSKRRD